MEKQRQFLQAYEYLCHIGEAKEWIERILVNTLPPIVQLEEALRDGVTLAELVQHFNPERRIRIFRHAKLQFRHSDNIAAFFRFLGDMELPELFRFELIDLYEKKNIPKVIYCIHALSWLLYRKGLVKFKIGNLLGQLEFERHELEAMQKGLDKAGVSMPSFAGVGESFGGPSPGPPPPPPPPEPVVPKETEAERQARELADHEPMVLELQSQIRASNARMRLGNTMQGLWDAETAVINLQSSIRAKWAREIFLYRQNMKQSSVQVQSAARGFLVRSQHKKQTATWQGKQDHLVRLQSRVRAARARTETHKLKATLHRETKAVAELQSIAKAVTVRRALDQQKTMLHRSTLALATLQAKTRAFVARENVTKLTGDLKATAKVSIQLQSRSRGYLARQIHHSTLAKLSRCEESVAELQDQIRGCTVRQRVTKDLQSLEYQAGRITTVQSTIRGMLERRRLSRQRSALDDQLKPITKLQSLGRAMITRLHVDATLAELESTEDSIIGAQTMIRAAIVRQKFAEKQRFFKENMEKVVKVQSFVRAKLQGEAYKSLTSGDNPPVTTVKNFVHLLNDSDFDFDEEVEFERLRKTVVQHVRQNEMADQYIAQLDIKIALLVKNKITLDEVVKHQKSFGGASGSLLSRSSTVTRDPFDLKALNKNSRRKLEQYQELFFILQTQPQYLARLFRRMHQQGKLDTDCEKTKHLMMGLFGYAQKRREEYYLVKLLARSVREDVEHTPSLQDFMRGTFFWTKLFAAYTKSPRDRKYLRDLLYPTIKESIVDNAELDLESNPMEIYFCAIENEELRTGQRSKRSRDVTMEEAIRDPEAKRIFVTHLQDLRDLVDQFLLSLRENLPKMPFGVRYLAQQMYIAITNKYPHDEKGRVLQLVGHWVWKNYLLPAMADPEKVGVVDRGLSHEHRKNLKEVTKVLGSIAAGRLFGREEAFLQPLNVSMGESIEALGDIWSNLIEIPTAESHFDIDEFNDLYSRTKPTLFIKLSDMFAMHQTIASEVQYLCTSREDGLQEIIRELGNVKNNESELKGVGSSEFCLTLMPKLHETEDPEAEIKALFTETKRCILYIIRVQSGRDLLEVMVKPITAEDEDRWEAVVRDELTGANRRKGAYAEASTLIDLATLSYTELKRIALENIIQLERFGRLSRNNHYQDVLNAIAVDIRTKHRRRVERQREVESTRSTLSRLNDQAMYLEGQLKTYNDYIEQAMMTLQNKKGKKRFVLPFTKQWDHERELARSGRVPKFGSYKYSAQELTNRGILISWSGYGERHFAHMDLTISSNEVGIFTLEGSNGPIGIPGATAEIPLEDLLQAQYNNTQEMQFFDESGRNGGGLRVNVNLFVHLIMRKFYKNQD